MTDRSKNLLATIALFAVAVIATAHNHIPAPSAPSRVLAQTQAETNAEPPPLVYASFTR